jgi:serine/threonine-protein kinase
LIAGRYQLESLLGEGGMAAVWRAIDTTLERRVAVKLLYARDERQHAQRISRFKREARIAAAVQHPNVVSIVDFGTTEEQQPYMVMEMLHGQSLGERLEHMPGLTLEELVRIAASTLRGLDAVHAAGITHKDIKPDNIFLHQEGNQTVPKILDFGISSLVHADGQRTSAHTTKDGVFVGTPEYMSPEQCRGGQAIDLRSDIYSMGVVLYEALVGKLPFESENTGDLIVAIVKSTPPSLDELRPDLPRSVAEVVRKAMALKPEQRFGSAGEMREALLTALDLGPTPSDMPLFGKNERVARAAARAAAPTSARARGVWRYAWLGAVMAIAGLVLWLSRGPSMTTDPGGSLRRQAAASAPRPAPPSAARAPVAPAAPTPSMISVELRGVPDDGRVTIDGQVSLQTPLQLPRDGSDRLIRVSAKGKTEWQVVHRASADGVYDVVLSPAKATTDATTSRSRPLKPAAAPPSAQFEPPKSLPRLDF